ncbi:uncharacterized protein SOCEGT47_013810 [Sorangium cellulosum]|uniref:Uncharacterized protein n=1 Tax=Sorangium cellulosum TaxID=56 RepID=A0A4P2PVS6_SORCE|nr:uncharacterized protein SOCEGT47_013810 [Sorangium cellulosum]
MRPDTEFVDTLVVPRLSAPHRPGKNIVYCATFRMALRTLCDRVGGAVALRMSTTSC